MFYIYWYENSDRFFFRCSIGFLQINLLQPEMEKYKTIQKLIQSSPTGNFTILRKPSHSFFYVSDSSRQHLLLNNESISGCNQVLNSLSNLLYAFARIANTCL